MGELADVDVAIVGAGIIGLASAAALSRAGKSVVVLERHRAIAQEMTARNSEVVHAGIYYPRGSDKARFCVAGRRALYQRCAERKIAHRKLGKWIVATNDAELDLLEALQESGRENGVEGLELVSRETLSASEPDLRAAGALRSSETGIVDAHAFSLSFQAEAEAHAGVVALGQRVEALALQNGRWRIETRGEDGLSQSLSCSAVVNAAGLSGDRIAELAGVDIDAARYRLHPCKGDYFALAPGAPLRFSSLVYPVPAGPGLGIHATVDLGGRVRFGPDATYVDGIDYEVAPAKAEDFARAIARYLPSMRAEWLSPDYAGIRPKLSGPGEAVRDFVVAEESGRGLPGLVNCIGIESPGLTAAPAIADRVAQLVASI